MICRHWKSKGECLYGDRCKFAHPEDYCNGAAAPQELGEIVEKSNELIEIAGKAKTRKRNKLRKSGRAGVFRRWLIDHVGRDELKKGSGVLDIAGGKGELAWELMNLNGVNCTVIDPRIETANNERLERKLRKGMFHRNEPLMEKYVDCVDFENVRVENPAYFRLFWQDLLWKNALDECENIEESYLNWCSEASRVNWTFQGLKNDLKENDEKTVEIQINWAQVRDTIRNCSMIVGLHPDQAAEGIVDFALAANKPFALLPCCVYAKEFPKRKMKDGRPVHSYSELIEYLVSKDPERIKAEILGFEGRNVLLYRI
jgi:hypothetical protein